MQTLKPLDRSRGIIRLKVAMVLKLNSNRVMTVASKKRKILKGRIK